MIWSTPRTLHDGKRETERSGQINSLSIVKGSLVVTGSFKQSSVPTDAI